MFLLFFWISCRIVLSRTDLLSAQILLQNLDLRGDIAFLENNYNEENELDDYAKEAFFFKDDYNVYFDKGSHVYGALASYSEFMDLVEGQKIKTAEITCSDVVLDIEGTYTSTGGLAGFTVVVPNTEKANNEIVEALDKANFILAGIDEKSLLQAVEVSIQMNLNKDFGIPVPDYIKKNVSLLSKL